MTTRRTDTYDEANVFFTYHRPGPGDQERYVAIREKAKELALLLREVCPFGRELALARTKLEECVMHANAGVARQRDPEDREGPTWGGDTGSAPPILTPL